MNQPKRRYTLRQNMFNLNAEKRRQLSNLQCGSMLALSVIILQALLTTTQPDTLTCITLIALAIALPTLAGALFCNFGYQCVRIDSLILGIIGTLAALTALAAMLWRISWIAGLIFLLTLLLTSHLIELSYQEPPKEPNSTDQTTLPSPHEVPMTQQTHSKQETHTPE